MRNINGNAIILSLFMLLLMACGFQLRGLNKTGALIDELSVTVIGDPTSEAVHAFQNRLNENDILIVDNKVSPWRVIISDFKNSRQIAAVGGVNGNIRDIYLINAYRIEVFYQGSSLGDIMVSSHTNVEYNSAQFIGSFEEEKNAHKQLADENANAAIRFIHSRVLKIQGAKANLL